jgi:hypothetical protein
MTTECKRPRRYIRGGGALGAEAVQVIPPLEVKPATSGESVKGLFLGRPSRPSCPMSLSIKRVTLYLREACRC